MRHATRVTPDRIALMAHVVEHPGQWGADIIEALGWKEERFWRAADCPLFDCSDMRFRAGYRLTPAGLLAWARVDPAKEAERQAERRARMAEFAAKKLVQVAFAFVG